MTGSWDMNKGEGAALLGGGSVIVTEQEHGRILLTVAPDVIS